MNLDDYRIKNPHILSEENRKQCRYSGKQFDYQTACSICRLGVLKAIRYRCPYLVAETAAMVKK